MTTSQAPAFIRTYVPLLVGALVTWLAGLGVTLDDPTRQALNVVIGGVAAAIYYALVRWAEAHWPWVGALLGSAKSPDTYSKGNTPPEHGDDAPDVNPDLDADDAGDEPDDLDADEADSDDVKPDDAGDEIEDEDDTPGRHVADAPAG